MRYAGRRKAFVLAILVFAMLGGHGGCGAGDGGDGGDGGAVAADLGCSSTSECQEKYEDCLNKAPTSCLKKSEGKTVCKRCQQRCEAEDKPSAECRKCLF